MQVLQLSFPPPPPKWCSTSGYQRAEKLTLHTWMAQNSGGETVERRQAGDQKTLKWTTGRQVHVTEKAGMQAKTRVLLMETRLGSISVKLTFFFVAKTSVREVNKSFKPHSWLVQTITKQLLQIFIFIRCRHPYLILGNQHVKQGYMEFHFKGGIIQD